LHSNNFIRVLKTPDNITPELLQKCIQDDRKAIQVLYKICFGTLMPVCLRYHNNEEDARSSFHLAFMKILQNLKKMPDNLIFFPWAKRITVNTLIDEYRKKRNYSDKISGKETERELEISGNYYENDGEQEIGYELILKIVAELPDVTGKVFNLFVIEGYSHKEISEMLDMSEGTSKWHLSTGRKTIREKLEQLEKINNELKMAL
jgi:RNA polymerase sigma factor (sigma-70 family)